MDNHQKFLNHLDQSQVGVWLIANWLSNRGNSVTINPTTKAKTHDEWKDNVDSGDIYISQRVEVKSLSASFTSANDWPFGGKFIVCAKHSYDNAKPKPYMYVYLNKEKTHVAIVSNGSYRKWYVESRVDSRYNDVVQEFYFCPLDSVVFMDIRKDLSV